MAPLVPVSRLTDALDWDLSPAELADATDALEMASDLVRGHGLSTWTEVNCPPLAAGVALAAAKRYMRTYEGLTQSRAGDETLAYTDLGERMLSVYLTDTEKATLSALVGRSAIVSVEVTAWRSKDIDTVGYVPVEGGEQQFPFFASDSGSI